MASVEVAAGGGADAAETATFPPDHLCFRERSDREDVLERFYEVTAQAVPRFHAGMDAEMAIVEAARRVAMRLGIADVESDCLRQMRLMSGRAHGGLGQDNTDEDVLVIACSPSPAEAVVYMETRRVEPMETWSPSFDPIVQFACDGEPSGGAVWRIKHLSRPLPSEYCVGSELQSMKFRVPLEEGGSSLMLAVEQVHDLTEDLERDLFMDSLFRIDEITRDEEARKNQAIQRFAQAEGKADKIIPLLYQLVDYSDEDAKLKIIASKLRRLVYWMSKASSADASENISAVLEVLSRLATSKLMTRFGRAFLEVSKVPCVILAAAECLRPSAGEISNIALKLQQTLLAQGWDVRVVTTLAPNEAHANMNAIHQHEGIDVYANNSSTCKLKYAVRLPGSIYSAADDQRPKLRRQFAVAALAAFAAQGEKPAAIISCGWPAADFPEVICNSEEQTELARHFTNVKLMHVIEPQDVLVYPTVSARALSCVDYWGTCGISSMHVPQRLADVAPRQSEPVNLEVGHEVNQRSALHSTVAARKGIVRRFLPSLGNDDTLVLVGIFNSGPQVYRKRSDAMKMLSTLLEASDVKAAVVVVGDENLESDTAMTELRRKYPRLLSVVPSEHTMLAMQAADVAVLPIAPDSIRNELFSLGIEVVSSIQSLLDTIVTRGRGEYAAPAVKVEVMKKAKGLDAQNQWSSVLSSLLQIIPVACPAPRDLDQRFRTEASNEIQAGRTTRIEIYRPNAETALVLGSMNGWTYPLQMESPSSDGRFRLKLKLPAGKHYYKLLIDGEWTTDDRSPEEVDSAGYRNNFLTVT